MGLLNDKTSPWNLQMEDKLHSLAYLLLPLQHKQLSEVQNVSAFPSVLTLEVKVEVSPDTPEGHPRAAKGGKESLLDAMLCLILRNREINSLKYLSLTCTEFLSIRFAF